MRHGTSGRRQRSRGNGSNSPSSSNGGGRRGNGSRMQVYDSNGPDVRIRGTAHQVAEKYTALAKDAASSDDLILSQSYLQHAEHYQRIISALNEDVRTAQSREKKTQDSRPNSQESDGGANNDLSLPTSILGGKPEVDFDEEGEERTSELSEA